jgi:hypothetical protein
MMNKNFWSANAAEPLAPVSWHFKWQNEKSTGASYRPGSRLTPATTPWFPRSTLSRGREPLLATATTASSARFAHTHTHTHILLLIVHMTRWRSQILLHTDLDLEHIIPVPDHAAASLLVPTHTNATYSTHKQTHPCPEHVHGVFIPNKVMANDESIILPNGLSCGNLGI